MAQTGCQPIAGGSFGGTFGESTSHLSEITGQSGLTTWTCTDDPCPWGDSTSNDALAWPVSAGPVATRLGYTVAPAPYLPADSANGLTISITSGSASAYAGAPQDDSHRLLATIPAGASYHVSGLAADEVLSVQSDAGFGYRVTPPGPAGTTDAGTLPGGPQLASQIVTWTCAGDPCPWGNSSSNPALVWPATVGTVNTRLGYLVSAGIYLPAATANGADISIVTGDVRLHAGLPGEFSHRLLAIVADGETFHVSGLGRGEVLSVQADSPFTYRITLPPSDPGPGSGPITAIPATKAFWRCNIPGCTFPDWTGAVIGWPSFAAHQTNARSNDQSRSVFSANGTPLFPYMGAWAQGCEVTAESGFVQVIEWKRGADVWRETWLEPRQSHVIALVPPEDGAMIETYNGSPGFSVSLKNCTPQPIPQ